jgi:MFS family permease
VIATVLLFKYPRQVLIVVGLTAGGTTAFDTYTTYMQKFLKVSVGLNDNQTTMVRAGSLIFALCLQPIYGALSDRIGRKPLLIWFGLMGIVFTIPLLRSLQSAMSAGGAFVLIAAAWLVVAGYTSINALVKAELFPARVRACRSPHSFRHHFRLPPFVIGAGVTRYPFPAFVLSFGVGRTCRFALLAYLARAFGRRFVTGMWSAHTLLLVAVVGAVLVCVGLLVWLVLRKSEPHTPSKIFD